MKLSEQLRTIPEKATQYLFPQDPTDSELLDFVEANQPSLPFTTEWSKGFPSSTFIDPQTHYKVTQTAGIGEIPDSMTIYNLYKDRAQRMPNEPLYSYRVHGQWKTKTALEVLDEIREVAKGFIYKGFNKGDSIGFMCHSCYEWDLIDAAVVSIGGVLATIYDSDSPQQIRAILENSDAHILIVETIEMKEKAQIAIQGLEGFKNLYCIEEGDIDVFKAYGKSVSEAELSKRIDSITKKDLCSIVYTSGSTAAPKGVEMTHENYCITALNLNSYMPQILSDPTGSILMFLPQAHSFARAINYICVAGTLHIYIAESFKTLLTDLQVARPTCLIGVPRVYEKIYNAATQKAGHGLKGQIFARAAKNARKHALSVFKQNRLGLPATVGHMAYDVAVFSQLRSVLGGRAKWIVCGGAPLNTSLLLFFRGAGIPLYQGYGLTETTAPCAFTPPFIPVQPASVGIAFPGFSIRISDDSEIQVKGAATFSAYHKNEKLSKEAFTEDGWYITGDLGHITNDGYLYITGRKKDLIITAGGKNVSPGPLESAIKESPLVSQALVLGDRRPFISALITLEEPAVRDWLKSHHLDPTMSMEDIVKNAAVRAEIQKAVEKANAHESRAESVRKFIILPEDFTQENGLLTASMKVIRPKVLQRYEHLLNTQMYVPKR